MSCEKTNNSATCDGTAKNSHNSRGESVRNICIMAHVDHGKTTLADSLIATNGIISEKQAGSIRYMDSRSDEMERGITMKSSCITLAYPHNNQSFLVNLVDSPGHVDFTSEVSTAVRLCDGCILVVDVVEGVCAQTKAVMRQAWVAGVKPVLVLNKLDRLVIEKELSPLDAYYHLAHVLQQVNAYMGELYNTDVMGRTSLPVNPSTSSDTPDGGTSNESLLGQSRSLGDWCIEDVDDSDLYFNPTAGNVVFASAVDGWGFGISHFAEQFSNKLGMSHKALSKTLWGDYYITNKNGQKRVLKGARDKRKNPLFVTLILDNLYQLYSKVRPATANVEDIKKIADSLNVKVPARLYQTATESKARFMHIISNWLPLSRAVLDMVVLQLPPPTRITEDRARKLLTTATHDYSSLPPCSQALLPHLQRCSNADDAPLIVYVSKMFGVPKKKLDEAEETLKASQSNANGSSKLAPGRKNVSLTPQSSSTNNGAAHNGVEMPPQSSSTSNGAAINGVEMPPQSSSTSNGAAHSSREKTEVPGNAPEDYDVEEHEEEELLAFARVFSGSLKAGQEVYVLGPKHDPALLALHLTPDQHLPDDVLQRCSYITKCKVSGVFLLLGREVKALSAAGAGLMVGVRGLTGHIIKSGSVSSTPACPPFTHVIHSTSALGACASAAGSDPFGPLLRVQVLPRNPRCLPQLREGLRLLNQADPCVQVWLEATGEYIVGAAGEVHLQRCLADLEERYARVPVTASDPIVPFRETVVPRPLLDQTNEAIQGDNIHTNQQVGDGSVCTQTAIGRVRVRAVPLPASVVELLSAHTALLTAVSSYTSHQSTANTSYQSTATGTAAALESSDDNQVIVDLAELELINTSDRNVGSETSASLQEDLNESLPSVTSSAVATLSMPSLQPAVGVQRLSEESKTALSSLYLKMSEAFDAAGAEWRGAAEHVWSVGPHYCGPNVLLNRVSHYHRPPLWQHTTPLPTDSLLSAMDHGLVTGFQLCCAAGPLCEEPLRGVCFVIEEWTPPTQSEPLPPGKVIAVAKDLFLSALEEQPRRMMVATYSCVVSVTSEVLGRVYSVLGRRHGRILHGDITEGSTSWNVTAYLPIVESIDFANEIRKATSGEAQPQLVFSHWETLDMDPFWEPCTSEELKHFGEKSDTSNLALQYMNAVRKRKGLKEYGKKHVEFGEKQRTLTKNK